MEHIKKFLSLTVSLIILLSFAGTALAGQQLGATDFDDGVGLPWHIVESATGKMDFAIEPVLNRVKQSRIVYPTIPQTSAIR